jgi:hypothetical protein
MLRLACFIRQKELSMNQNIKITLTDALSFLLFIIPLVLAAMGLLPLVIGDIEFSRSFGRTGTLTADSSNSFLLAALILLPIALYFYFRRLSMVKNVVNNGTKVTGKIADIRFIKDRGYVVYQYQVRGKTFIAINRILKSKITEMLSIGKEVIICHDFENPKRAFIEEIYRSADN